MKLSILFILFLSITLRAEHLSYEQLIEEFNDFDIHDTYYDVQDIFFQKDIGKFVLTEGTIYPFTPVNGDTIGFYFDGKGKFIYSNTDPVETAQLIRLYDSKILIKDFSNGVFLFPYDEWKSFLKSSKKGDERYKLKYAKDKFKGKKTYISYYDKTISSNVAHQLLNNDFDYFFSSIDVGFTEDLVFLIDPLDDEEVILGRGYYITNVGNYYYPVCKTKSINKLNREKDILDVLHYDMNMQIDSKLKVTNNIKMKTVIKTDSPGWIEFRLVSKLLVNSVKNDKEENLNFYKTDKTSELWIDFGDDYSVGDTAIIEIDVYGDIFMKYNPNMPTLFSSIMWYPHWDYKDKATFEIKYTYPERYELVSGGKLISEDEINNNGFSHWKQELPVRNYSFNIGNYDIKSLSSSDNCPYNLKVYYKNAPQLDAVVSEIQSSLAFYTQLFGKLDIDDISAAYVYSRGGEAFKGMINLFPGSFYLGKSYSDGAMESLTAHEIAHQWWGISVDYETYRDQWLSEAFAEYSSLLFLQLYYKNNELFFKYLDEYRQDLIKAGKGLLFDGVTPGPIYLGYRNETVTTRGDFSLIVYKKGAWVMHMLRNMLMDILTLDDNLFFQILKEFYTQNKNKTVTTEDFIKFVEYKLVVDLSWFFEQWVYGSDIPSYSYSFNKISTEGNKCKVKLYIKQENVPADFKASIPVTFKFDDDLLLRFRVFMTGEEVTIDFPETNGIPTQLIFNDFYSVLCEAKEVKWDDEFDKKEQTLNTTDEE